MVDGGDEKLTQEQAIMRRTTSDQVAEVLRARVMRGELPPGTPLREVVLAESLGVSRNTLREGVRILVAEGIMRHNMHRGVFVASPGTQDVREIFEIRRLLELRAVKKSDAALGRLMRDIADGVDGAVAADDRGRVVDLCLAFHVELVRSLCNARLTEMYVNALAELRLALFFIDKSDEETSVWVGDHCEIARLIAEEARQSAARLLLQHLTRMERSVLSVLAAQTASSG
jgi:DNA-binding GntR family transcriptional regulator